MWFGLIILHEIETSTSNFKRSADAGYDFGGPQNLRTNPPKSTAAQVAIHQANVYVVWENESLEMEIYFLSVNIDYCNSKPSLI